MTGQAQTDNTVTIEYVMSVRHRAVPVGAERLLSGASRESDGLAFWLKECMSMATDLLTLAEGIFVMKWYSWVGIAGIIVVIIAYKIYQNKMMS